jgi:uncharacterized membrane protein YvbJ
MALINCPECGKEISDTAKHCPNCGFKIQPSLKESVKKSISGIDVQKKKKIKIIAIIIAITLVVIGAAIGIGYAIYYNSPGATLDRNIRAQQDEIDMLNDSIGRKQQEIDDLENAWSRYEYYNSKLN